MGGDFESTHMRAQVDDEREAEAAGDEAHCTFLLRLCQVCASEAQHSAHIHDIGKDPVVHGSGCHIGLTYTYTGYR